MSPFAFEFSGFASRARSIVGRCSATLGALQTGSSRRFETIWSRFRDCIAPAAFKLSDGKAPGAIVATDSTRGRRIRRQDSSYPAPRRTSLAR